jgi:hypothetical protein
LIFLIYYRKKQGIQDNEKKILETGPLDIPEKSYIPPVNRPSIAKIARSPEKFNVESDKNNEVIDVKAIPVSYYSKEPPRENEKKL